MGGTADESAPESRPTRSHPTVSHDDTARPGSDGSRNPPAAPPADASPSDPSGFGLPVPLTTRPAPRPRPGPPPPSERARSRRLTVEIWIVMGLSLGQAGVYAVVAIIAALTRGPIGDQTTTVNPSQSDRPYLDLTYQILSLVFVLVPVLLALYLLSDTGRNPFHRIGLDLRRPAQDLGWGVLLGLAIGIPGLALYAAGRALGITVHVQASGLNPYWWTVPILLLAALKNGLLEEVLVVGYLFERLREKRWSLWSTIVLSSVIRASYHLYQGWGPFAGNFVMGLVFGWFYTTRWGRRRVMPLVVAHTLIDIVAFVGYAFLPAAWLAALGVG